MSVKFDHSDVESMAAELYNFTSAFFSSSPLDTSAVSSSPLEITALVSSGDVSEAQHRDSAFVKLQVQNVCEQ